MAEQIVIKIEGLEEALSKLSKIENAILDFNKPFDQIIIQMQRSFADSFNESGREGQWEENREATQIIKKSSKPLIDDRFLQFSLTGITSDSIVDKGPQTLEFGTTRPYADIQEEGIRITVTPKMRAYMGAVYGIILPDEIEIPARPFMFFTDKDINNIKTIFTQWLQNEVNNIAG